MIPIAIDDNGKRQMFQIEYSLGVTEKMSFTRGARDAVDDNQATVRGTVKLRQTVQGTRSSLSELRPGTLDVVLVSVHNSSDTTIELIPMHSESIVFVWSSNHPLCGLKQISLSEIADESFIDFPEGWGNRTLVDAAFSASGMSRVVRAEVISFEIHHGSRTSSAAQIQHPKRITRIQVALTAPTEMGTTNGTS